MTEKAGPFYSVRLIATSDVAARGRTTSLGKELDGSRDVTDFIESFVFEDTESEHDLLTLRIDNHDGRFNDDPGWQRGNLIQFVFGYPDAYFGPRIHVIDSKRGFRTLTVTAIEEAAVVNKAKSRIWENTTKPAIVKAIVAEGSFLTVNSTDIDESTIADEKPTDYQQSRQTDWQFLKRLAEKISYELYVEGNVLHFHPRRLDRPPRRSYTYFSGSGELMSFDVDDERILDRAGEVVACAWDPIERKRVDATGSNSETKRDTLGSQGAIAALTKGQGGELAASKKVITTPQSDPVRVKLEADTHFKRSEQKEIRATAKIIGDPELFAKQVIEIRNLGDALSGKFYIVRHTHRLDGQNGYEGELKLLRNAVGSLPSLAPPSLDSSQAAPNTAEVPVDRRQSIVRDPVTGDIRQEPR